MNKITRAVVTAIAAGAALLTTTTPAMAAGPINCGTTVNDYGKLGFTSCFWAYDDHSVIPMATLRTYSTMDSTLWTSCTMRIYVFRQLASETSFNQWRTSEQDCLSVIRFLSITAPNSRDFFDNRPFLVGNVSYKVVSRWFGTYNGSAVGSHVNAESTPLYGLAPAVPTDTVNGLVDIVPGVGTPLPI
jgi:hypothetical protein